MDLKKIAIVIIKHDETRFANLEKEVCKLRLPSGFSEGMILNGAGKLSKVVNQARKMTDAAYCVFISDEVKTIENLEMLTDIVHYFNSLFDINLIGFLGGGIPVEGDIAGAGFHLYGRRDFATTDGTLISKRESNPRIIQKIDSIDPAIFATCGDGLEWDEEIDDIFAPTAHILDLKRHGRAAIIYKQVGPSVTFYSDSVYQRPKNEEYENERKIFCQKYPEETMPLVSIPITTYNQPEFFKKTLESALAQDYPRMEIIVGDDSTDDRTERLIQPYLKKYSLIRYTHHEKPLGGRGLQNLNFCLNKVRGEYVNILFHDDVFYPGKIRRMVNAYKEDVEGQLGLVTSPRSIISEEGTVLIKNWNCSPYHDEIVPGRIVGREMLTCMVNCIGELTTVLFKKEDALHWGYYRGYHDKSLGDLSTFLEICETGRSVLFLSTEYSAAGKHGEQNSYNTHMLVECRLTWFALAVISYLNNVFFSDQNDFKTALRLYVNVYRANEFKVPDNIDESFLQRYDLYCALMEVIEEERWDVFLHKMIEDMIMEDNIPECVFQACSKDKKTGMWRKTIHQQFK